MFPKRVVIIIIIISAVISCGFSQLNADTYGPFKVRWKSYDLCSGPKKTNLTHVSTSLIVEDDVYKGEINMTFAANTRIDEIKLSVTAEKNTKPIAWSYRVQKPCQHYSIAWVLNQDLNAQNCVVKKGTYHTRIDFTDATNKFFANRFFYGEYVFKLLVLSNKGNIACIIFNPVFTKA